MKKEIRALKAYSVVITMLVLVLYLSSFSSNNRIVKFDEIDVQRINIIESDGSLKMVISNKERQHPGICNGKVIEREEPRAPGILFFNHLGDEMGGIMYGENGKDGHFGTFTWDKVRSDQTMGYRYIEDSEGNYESGIQMWQRPNFPSEVELALRDSVSNITSDTERKKAIKELIEEGKITRRRMFIGKNRNDDSVIEMLDKQGNSRLALMVSSDGTPQLIFLDEEGSIIYRIPEESEVK